MLLGHVSFDLDGVRLAEVHCRTAHPPGCTRRRFRWTLPGTEGDLGAVGGHVQRDDERVIAEPEAVQERNQPAVGVQAAGQQLCQPAGRGGDGATDTSDFDVPVAVCSTAAPTARASRGSGGWRCRQHPRDDPSANVSNDSRRSSCSSPTLRSRGVGLAAAARRV